MRLVDDAFLRDSILNPSSTLTAGYAPIMPTYQGQISEEGLIDLVEYIKTLHSNDRIQQTLNTSLVQGSMRQEQQGRRLDREQSMRMKCSARFKTEAAPAGMVKQ